MKKEIYLTLFLLIIFSTGFVSAIDTQINVRTWPNHKVSIFVLKTGEVYNLLNSYHINPGSTGEASIVYSGDDSTIKLIVKITKDSKTVLLQKFESEFATGSPIYLQVIPNKISENYKQLDEQKAQNTTNQTTLNQTTLNQTIQNTTKEVQTVLETENTTEINSSITGAVISENSSIKIPSFVWYILLGLIIAGTVAFSLIKLKPKITMTKTQHHGKVALKSTSHREFKDTTNQLEEAERKIKEAQEEINKLKNKSKIDEVRARIQKEQEELSRLEKGGF